jgi:regulator of replication initiation timing
MDNSIAQSLSGIQAALLKLSQDNEALRMENAEIKQSIARMEGLSKISQTPG